MGFGWISHVTRCLIIVIFELIGRKPSSVLTGSSNLKCKPVLPGQSRNTSLLSWSWSRPSQQRSWQVGEVLIGKHGHKHHVRLQIDGLVQERRTGNSSVLAMELHISCTNPSKCLPYTLYMTLNLKCILGYSGCDIKKTSDSTTSARCHLGLFTNTV